MKLLSKFKKHEHKYMPYGEYYDTEKDGSKTLKHIWKCTKCGKLQYGK